MDQGGPFVHAEVARKLERERDEALKESEYYKARYEQLKDERDEANKKHLCDSHRDMTGNCMVCSMESWI